MLSAKLSGMTLDLLALGAMNALQAEGLSVPEDIALAGYNDIQMASFVHPGLTTASLQAAEMGSLALGMLQEMITSNKPSREITTIPTQLIIRQSCGCKSIIKED